MMLPKLHGSVAWLIPTFATSLAADAHEVPSFTVLGYLCPGMCSYGCFRSALIVSILQSLANGYTMS